MLNKAELAQKREAKIEVLKQKCYEDVLTFEKESLAKSEEVVKNTPRNEGETDTQYSLRKANIRQSYIDRLHAYKSKKYRKLSRDIKRLERRDARYSAQLNRIWEIDLLRGIIILGMIVDHLMYDFTFSGLFGGYMFLEIPNTPSLEWVHNWNYFATGYWSGDFRVTLRVLGVVLLVFLCGISSTLSKNNLKRGAILFGAGVVMTVGLNIFGKIIDNPSFIVIVSTITMLGYLIMFYSGAKLLYVFLESRLMKQCYKEMKKGSSWKWVALTVAISVFAFWFLFRNAGIEEFNRNGRTLLEPYTGHGATYIANYFPDKDEWSPGFRSFIDFFLKHDETNPILNFFLLFNNEGSFCQYAYQDPSTITFRDFIYIVGGARGLGVDWLGLFPMLGHIFLGGFIGEVLYKDKKSIIYYFFKKENRAADDPLTTIPGKINAILNRATCFITYPGQKTIFIYIFHQPVIFVLFSLIILMLGGSIVF